MRSFPINTLRAACNETPMGIRHLYICYKYKRKLLWNSGHSQGKDILTKSRHEKSPTRNNYLFFYRLTNFAAFANLAIANTDSLISPALSWQNLTPRLDTNSLTFIINENPILIAAAIKEYISKQYMIPSEKSMRTAQKALQELNQHFSNLK